MGRYVAGGGDWSWVLARIVCRKPSSPEEIAWRQGWMKCGAGSKSFSVGVVPPLPLTVTTGFWLANVKLPDRRCPATSMLTPTGVGTDRVVGSEASWGLGVGLDADGFGMGGTGGSFGWWSEAGGYALTDVRVALSAGLGDLSFRIEERFGRTARGADFDLETRLTRVE